MFRVRIETPAVDYNTGRVVARFEVLEGNFREWLDGQDIKKDYRLEIRQDRKPRSLDANSYFHVLCGKIADRIGSSKAEVKNRMISLYGQPEIMEDGGLNYIIVREEMDVGKFETLHLQTTSQTKELNGKLYRVYIRMRGTGWKGKEGYTTEEMARLIDGTISEAKEIGMAEAEIMSTREKRILEQVYGVKT